MVLRKSWLCDAEISYRCDKKRVLNCKKQKSHRFFDVSSKIQRSSNLLFPLLARGLEGIKYFLNICTCFYAQNYLIRRSLEFFRVSRKNRDDVFGYSYAKVLALALVLSLGAVSESWAACNGATATTAGKDENGNYCGSWDCGAQGSNITCTLEKGTLTISGEGEMRDYTQSGNWTCETCYPKMFNTDAPWAGKMITKAMVEGNVTKIGQFTFAGETYLTEISGMKNIKSIGRSAFNRTGLLSIDIPNVTELDRGAFYKAENLQYINFNDDVIILNNDWFSENGGAFTNVEIVKNSCVTNPETGMKTCGSCGDKYIKSGTGCVSECGSGYHTDLEAKRCIKGCANGQVEYKGECLDEYPFSRKHWTPVEAAQWLNEDNNTITLTFKK